MRVLIFGGTGAMGKPTVDLLTCEGHEVYVTTRKNLISDDKYIHYICGDAKDMAFVKSLLKSHYDVLIDFMVYTTKELSERIDILLDGADQYIFLSSSRVYADVNGKITESSPRLLDVCVDKEYISTDEYALAKAREEDVIRSTGKKNFTILRPYVTVNDHCIKLGVYEKEHWLRRALAGRTIVFPKDIANSKTCLTYGNDVAASIVGLIHNEKAYGEVFHVTTDEVHSWDEILNMYLDAIEKETGHRPKVKYATNSDGLQTVWNKWQIIYDRLFDRKFDNSKIESACGDINYHSTLETINLCIHGFLQNPKWNSIDGKFEAWCDRQCGEWTPLKEISGKKNKLIYLKYRIFG